MHGSMRRREETRPVGPTRAARSRRLSPTLQHRPPQRTTAAAGRPDDGWLHPSSSSSLPGGRQTARSGVKQPRAAGGWRAGGSRDRLKPSPAELPMHRREPAHRRVRPAIGEPRASRFGRRTPCLDPTRWSPTPPAPALLAARSRAVAADGGRPVLVLGIAGLGRPLDHQASLVSGRSHVAGHCFAPTPAVWPTAPTLAALLLDATA